VESKRNSGLGIKTVMTTYKYAGIIGAALITFVGLTGKPSKSQSLPQQEIQQPEPIITPNRASEQQNIQQADLVPEFKLSYKLETFNSRVMGGKRTYGVSLPPGYAESPDQRYPVIFLLHGGHGTPRSWFEKEKGSVLTTLQKLYGANKLPPSIIITPDGYDERGTTGLRDPEYIDGPNGRMATHIGSELVKVVQSRYRTLPAPNYWAIGGLSSGGWGALNIGLHYTEHFSILFSHSGYFRDKTGPGNSPIDIVKTLSTQERQNLKIYLDTGKSDSAVLSQNRQFHAVLNQLKIKNVLREFPGEHTWRYWRQHLTDALMFVDEQFEWAPEPK
jgi:enterochelin esterase-like enzyme